MDELERALSKGKLLEVEATLANLQEAFAAVRMADDEQSRQAAMANGICALARLCVMELATHLNEGMEFYGALRATARGELKLDPKLAKEVNKAFEQLHDPMRQN